MFLIEAIKVSASGMTNRWLFYWMEKW